MFLVSHPGCAGVALVALAPRCCDVWAALLAGPQLSRPEQEYALPAGQCPRLNLPTHSCPLSVLPAGRWPRTWNSDTASSLGPWSNRALMTHVPSELYHTSRRPLCLLR